MDAAVRQEKGKLCFIKRKGKLFVLNIRSFCEKKFCSLGMRRRENENLWTFLRNSSSFPSFLPSFSSPSPAFLPFYSPVFLLLLPRLCCPRRSLACVGAPRRTPAPASRTQRVRNSCLHPSPSLLTAWQFVTCGWRHLPFSAFTGEDKSGEAFTLNPL